MANKMSCCRTYKRSTITRTKQHPGDGEARGLQEMPYSKPLVWY